MLQIRIETWLGAGRTYLQNKKSAGGATLRLITLGLALETFGGGCGWRGGGGLTWHDRRYVSGGLWWWCGWSIRRRRCLRRSFRFRWLVVWERAVKRIQWRRWISADLAAVYARSDHAAVRTIQQSVLWAWAHAVTDGRDANGNVAVDAEDAFDTFHTHLCLAVDAWRSRTGGGGEEQSHDK